MKTRYPIVLVHGLAMRDTFFMKSWGTIDRILRIQGYEVYKSQVDAFGTVKTNAAQQKEEILTVLRETGADKVNIIAHSKGGLDAKYMIRYLEMAPYVASLTTLWTPHAGSPIASFSAFSKAGGQIRGILGEYSLPRPRGSAPGQLCCL